MSMLPLVIFLFNENPLKHAFIYYLRVWLCEQCHMASPHAKSLPPNMWKGLEQCVLTPKSIPWRRNIPPNMWNMPQIMCHARRDLLDFPRCLLEEGFPIRTVDSWSINKDSHLEWNALHQMGPFDHANVFQCHMAPLQGGHFSLGPCLTHTLQ